MVNVQLLHRTVYPTLPIFSPSEPVSEDVSVRGTATCAEDAVGSARSTPIALGGSGSGRTTLKWTPRLHASYLTRSVSGTWYLRLVVPAAIRAAHPELPKELKRSTQTGQKRLARARAQKMCIDFFIRYNSKEASMLTPDERTKESFALVYSAGGIRMELAPNASVCTLQLMSRCMEKLQVQMIARGLRPAVEWQSGEPPNNEGALPHAGAAKAIPQGASTECGLNQFRGLDAVVPGSLNASDCETSGQTIWLSDAIDEWRLQGGVRFSSQSWENSYKPTFRVLLELVGEIRRDRTLANGSIVEGKLDIDVRRLRRSHIQSFHNNLQLLSSRQGQRDDGKEALERIAHAKAARLQLPSASSVSKKLGQVRPFLTFAANKDWLNAGVIKEMDLSVKAADAKLVNQQSRLKQKPGCVALSSEEVKELFEQPAFVEGATKADWCYWIPLLDLYQGLRVSEASQLYTNDILIIDGVNCLSIINDTTDETEDASEGASKRRQSRAKSSEEYRRLKTPVSRRIVPIHPKLVELGILDYVRAISRSSPRPIHLFKGLKWEEKSMFGRKPSQFMGELLRIAGIYRKRRKVPHSLRSNFKQALEKTLLSDNLQSRMLGHSTRSIKDTNYNETDNGPAFPVAEVLPFLAQVDFGLVLPTWAEIRELRIRKATP
ncbi:MAG: site-specific integrase [Burkholderiaceae bacterium]